MYSSALQGVRVADFTWLWAGAYATTLLAFLGAEVIKIESMARIDASRQMSITLAKKYDGADNSPIFNDINLNKLSVRLDLRKPEAVELAKMLVKISDVTAQNMRPGVMDELGLGYEVLRRLKPDIIMLSSSAFGAEGPLRRYSGYAPTFAAYSGLAHLTGYKDGPPNTLTGSTDLISAVTSAFSILAALNCRQNTGQGQHIDLSSVESLSILTSDALMDYAMNGNIQSRTGNHDRMMAPHNCYRCRGDDKWVSIAVNTEEEWLALCNAIGQPRWTSDERFSNNYNRWTNQEELDRLLTEWTIRLTHYEVTEILQSAGVAAIPSFSNEELFSDAHLTSRKLAVEVQHPVIGKQVVLQPPWRLSKTPARVTQAAPLIGENNEYVFGELLGIPLPEIERMIATEIIY